MPNYEFICLDCAEIQEVKMPMATATFEDRPCPHCQGVSTFKYSVPAISTVNMSNKSIDVDVGARANAKWNEVYRRQEIRDKVRKETQKVGLMETRRDSFQPVSSKIKDLRTRAANANR